MVNAVVPTDLDIYTDEEDPTEPGDIKVVKGALLVLDDCDAVTQWSVLSGAGVTISLETSQVYEGTGSIKVNIPAGIMAEIKCTKSATSWDITTQNYLKVALRGSYKNPIGNNFQLYFGETTYDEQTSGGFQNPATNTWFQKSWDISGIAAASRNAITMFTVKIFALPVFSQTVYIDYVFADPGPSAVKAFDGDRVITLYPKVYTGSYTGTGAALTVTLPRKGTPSSVIIQGANHPTFWKTTSMGTTNSLELGAGSPPFQTDRITALADCSFTLGTNADVNQSTHIYHYIAFWDD